MLDKPIIKLNDDFQETLNRIEQEKESFFITGKAGTGKSTLLQTFRNTTQKRVIVLAPTGVAALNVQGQTIHSFFGFPARYFNPAEIKPRRYRRLYELIDVIIIDEISMVRADLLDNIDYFLRLNRQNDVPFGGVQMLFFGDLYQLPPVVATPEEVRLFQTLYKSPYFFSANVLKKWQFESIEMQTIYRQTDRHFIRLLNEIRNGTVDEDTLESLNQRWEKVVGEENEEDDIITLSARNMTVEDINRRRMMQLDTVSRVFTGAVTGDFNEKLFPTDIILELKIGAQVMFVKNEMKKGFVNGMLGKIVDFKQETIMVEVRTKEKITTIEVERVTWEVLQYKLNEKGDIEPTPIGTYKQFPLKPAWAITIHKSQGKTFDNIVIDLGTGAFEHGQTYVALSRCRTLGGIRLRQPLRPKDIILDPRVIDFYENILR